MSKEKGREREKKKEKGRERENKEKKKEKGKEKNHEDHGSKEDDKSKDRDGDNKADSGNQSKDGEHSDSGKKIGGDKDKGHSKDKGDSVDGGKEESNDKEAGKSDGKEGRKSTDDEKDGDKNEGKGDADGENNGKDGENKEMNDKDGKDGEDTKNNDNDGAVGKSPSLDTSPSTMPNTDTGSPLVSPVAKDPVSSQPQTIPEAPRQASPGPNDTVTPYSPWSSTDTGANKGIASKPSGGSPDKESGTEIIAYILIPLTVIAGLAFGVVAYRRRTTRRRALRRRLQEDAELAVNAAASTAVADDATSMMSEFSYRPPAPFTSEVDVSTESMESNPEMASGNAGQHLIPAPKRDETHEEDYQDYSHVCQAQLMGKLCTNHSISCFVALNNSNAGLAASAAPRDPPSSMRQG
ncbi:hypothetical protein BGZ51_005602 [Haplosporangium sp. Z 767]|nr:hypothetical protein BGZ51_005602 [Haplosporangium sp. Z 767]